uniref:Uncharacterized protein n=1 Tax=Anguilla anguilla TaxID=7936 RepID=A0A0E9U1Q0_ANGAN
MMTLSYHSSPYYFGNFRGSRHSSRPSKINKTFDFITFNTFDLVQLWKIVLQKLHQTECFFFL